VTVYYGLTVIPWVDRHLMYPVLEFTAAGASKLLNLLGALPPSRESSFKALIMPWRCAGDVIRWNPSCFFARPLWLFQCMAAKTMGHDGGRHIPLQPQSGAHRQPLFAGPAPIRVVLFPTSGMVAGVVHCQRHSRVVGLAEVAADNRATTI